MCGGTRDWKKTELKVKHSVTEREEKKKQSKIESVIQNKSLLQSTTPSAN